VKRILVAGFVLSEWSCGFTPRMLAACSRGRWQCCSLGWLASKIASIMTLMKKVLTAVVIVIAVVWLTQNPPWIKTVPAKGPAFVVDPARDFHFELGRGSGWHGLETVAFGRDGVLTLFRQHRQAGWQRSALKLNVEAIARIFAVVNSEGIMKMPSSYQHTLIEDGTQWVLWISQDGMSKAIYFDRPRIQKA
jgi:hypothetical protein